MGQVTTTIRQTGNKLNGVGRQTIDTAGTPEALPDIACKRVFIQCPTDNSGAGICVGDANVVAAEATRKGMFLFAGQGDWFYPENLKNLYVDVLTNGDEVHWFYEN